MVDITLATAGDIPAIMPVFDAARAFMRSHGNHSQWVGYPTEEQVRADIAAGNLYLCKSAGEVVGVFAFIIGPDPTYAYIEGGQWRADRTYGTIHRLASTGKVGGLAKMCFDFCAAKVGYLRADTHKDNATTQSALARFGFRHCGTIYVRDGTPRLAYDYLP